MSTKLTAEETEKFKHVEHGSMGHLKDEARQRYEFNLLCWRIASRHKSCDCWPCVYVEGQRS